MPEPRAGEIAFTEAREQLERAVEQHLAKLGDGLREQPRFELERGEVRFSFIPPALDEKMILGALRVVKGHLENVRVHTFEQGYVIFQSLGENLYDPAGFAQGIKFRLSNIGSIPRVEVSRRANLVQDELMACISLFTTLVPVEAAAGDPLTDLSRLGVSVYRRADDERPSETFAGYKRTRLEIRESVVLPLTRPEIFRDVARLSRGHEGADIVPRAVLFEGPPGVGKTTMARLIARETGIPMVYVPVENILSKFYGESTQNLAAVFDAAARLEQVILFLDEIDSLAGSRSDGMFEATRRVLSVLLRKIEGFESREGVLTIGATNRTQDLDHALVSRFDQVIRFPLPDAAERSAIFGAYAVHLSAEDREALALASEGMSGRNIRDVCEYAERRWARKLISEKAAEASAPAAAIYLDILRDRQAVAAPVAAPI